MSNRAERRPGARLSRRDFVRLASAGGAAAAVAGIARPHSLLGMTGSASPAPAGGGTDIPGFGQDGSALRILPEVHPNDLTLRGEELLAHIGDGIEAPSWLLNGSLPSPLIRVRKGERFRVDLENDLPDNLILHWHGLTPPEDMDGHPRYAVRRGRSYRYDFTVENRAGTYWYHSHTHHKVGKHAYKGIGGLLIVEDDEEAALELPSGDREIPIILQDRRMEGHDTPSYSNPDTLEGILGDEPFGNGIRRPRLQVETALYRFRILNGSNARIFRLARDDGRKLVLIGNDGGLLDRPAEMEYIDLAPAERVDLLVDLRDLKAGDRLKLYSRAFHIAGGLATPERMHRQGHPLELLTLEVDREVEDPSPIPGRLLPLPNLPDPKDSVGERSFVFTSDRDMHTRTMSVHQINGLSYQMDRIDERVPFGETEIWSFINENQFAHPVHLHATHFRVLSREGGRGQVMPWERGLKDTVLVHPEETVKVAVRFSAHPGLFLLHCHNLEHEDVGMMLNILVE